MSWAAGGTRRSAARATLIGSGASAFISVAQALVLMPLSLRYLRADLYGAWLAAAEVLVWFQLLDLGLPNLLAQKVAAALGRSDREEAADWLTSCVVVLCVIVPVLLGAGLLLAELLPAWTGIAGAEGRLLQACFRLGLVASLLLLLGNAVVGLAWGVQRTAIVSTSVVAGAAAGVGVSILLLMRGWGLWALPVGLLVRAVVALGGSLVLVARLRGAGLRLRWRRDGDTFRGLLSLLPATAGGNVAFLLSNHTEVVLVTTFFGTVPATIYVLTRKAAETLRTLLDTVGYAVYGGVANLVSSPESGRSRRVVNEIGRSRFALACLAAAAYVGLNRGFVHLLFGEESYGGTALTIVFALVLVVGGQGFLLNYLYRASGALRDGSLLFIAEAAIGAAAMAAGLQLFGLLGAPAAATLVACVFLLVTRRRLARALPPATAGREPVRGAGWVAALSIFGVGIAVAVLHPPLTWPELAATGLLLMAAGGAVVLAFDGELRRRLWSVAWAFPTR